jgi:uracil-DNA glycosylase family 4
MEHLVERKNDCTDCALHEGASQMVMGSGNLDSKIVLIGEGPGRKEDEMGLPFVGSAGKLLDELLDQAGMKRVDLFITNIVKCRPPKNRKPRKSEIKECEPILDDQLNIIKPCVIAPMGNSAVNYFFERYGLGEAVIGEVHGEKFEVEEKWGKVILIPLYHPAAAIYNRSLLEDLENDMKLLKTLKAF